MYVLIDRQKMAITHKHRDREVLAKLSWIECTNAGIQCDLNLRKFLEFTPAELKLLYKNATGNELSGYGNALAHAVLAMAKRLPESDVIPEEVFAQALCVSDGDKSCYSYAKGSKTPTTHRGLFIPEAITCERCEAEEQIATTAMPGYTPPAHPVAGRVGGANPVASTSTQANVNAAPSAPRAPRVGGAKEIIFKVADEIWAAAGSPRDLAIVLPLRKQMMDILEASHNVKRATASSTLGEWQKQRLTNINRT